MQRQNISFGGSGASRGKPSAAYKYGSNAPRAAPPVAPCELPKRSSVPTRAQKANGVSKAGMGPVLCAAPCSAPPAPKITSAKQRVRGLTKSELLPDFDGKRARLPAANAGTVQGTQWSPRTPRGPIPGGIVVILYRHLLLVGDIELLIGDVLVKRLL